MVKNPPTMRETWVHALGWEDPLGEGMATLSSMLAWQMPRTEEPGGLWSSGLQRVGHDWETAQQFDEVSKIKWYELHKTNSLTEKGKQKWWNQTCLHSSAITPISLLKITEPTHGETGNLNLSQLVIKTFCDVPRSESPTWRKYIYSSPSLLLLDIPLSSCETILHVVPQLKETYEIMFLIWEFLFSDLRILKTMFLGSLGLN